MNDKKKQIEEIVKDVCERYANGICSVDGKPCEEISVCEYRRVANRLYNAGYRKQSDVAREIIAEIRSNGKFDDPFVEYICLSFDDLDRIERKYTDTEKGGE